jgi:O-antigen/teichoic acid export membrane protein
MKTILSEVHKLVVDVMAILFSRKKQYTFFKIPLYSNAIYLMLANISNALFGFVFWMVAARFYSADDVGLASAVLSAASLLAMLSGLGFGYGLIRFLEASKNPINLINSSFSIGGLVSVMAALIFILGIGFWSPALTIIRTNIIYLVVFVLFVPASTLSSLTDQSFIARRRASFVFTRSLMFNILRLTLLVLLTTLLHSIFIHLFGIFGSWAFSIFFALLFGISLLLPRVQSGYHLFFTIDRKAVSEVLHFSFTNYLCDLFGSIPSLVLPILVVNLLGTENNAYFFVAWAMSATLTMIPSAISTSFLAEGSHDEARLEQNIWSSLKMVSLILTPAVILVWVFADKILLLYGRLYVQNSATLLRLLAASTFPLTINSLYFSLKKVEKRLKSVIILTSLSSVVTLGLSYLLLPGSGITGVGIAWLISQCGIALIIIAFWLKKR